MLSHSLGARNAHEPQARKTESHISSDQTVSPLGTTPRLRFRILFLRNTILYQENVNKN